MITALLGRCPVCEQGHVFSGVYAVRERCEVCGAVFLRDEGNWIGATVVAYMLGAAYAMILLLVLWSTGVLKQGGFDWVVPVTTVVFLLLVFRPVKGFWVGLLNEWGYVYPDPPAGSPRPSGPR